MIRYLKQYKLLLFLTVLFTAISSLSYVFIGLFIRMCGIENRLNAT